jgi:valyl-tRNA synthetase
VPELPSRYDPATVEARLYAQWESSGVFHEEADPARPPFVISMPPPNITGRAHIGHASTYTPMDVLTRYHRMLGNNAVWIPGQDHAAIATEAVIVRELASEGTSRDALGREKYLERAWRWREEFGGIIDQQFRTLGFGPDWQRERFTMDEGLSTAVVKVFVALYREGLIYRGTRLVNWDPVSKSTLSDAEVDDEERDGNLWGIRYRGEDGSFSIEVVTTRPETMLGDTAVAVHPDDERYAHLVGKHVVVPLAGRRVPIVADAAVERDFGTGAVKVTPAHDPLDNEIGERHGLEMLTVIGFDAKMTAEAGAPYAGLDRFDARKRVVADLEASGHLVSVEPHRHRVPVSSRSGAVVEPLLSLQWFCKMESLAKPALDAYRDGHIRFVPERFGRTYEAWLDNIRDWNVSRQVWWGHRLPVWYTPADEPVVAETEEEARAIAQRDHGTADLRRDPDTLDTWFSSALWPFSILGWPDGTPELEHWYPNQVMITSRDIIFLWVARMVMLGMKFAGGIPFREVFITPLVFDLQGRKMSKSLRNVIDPLDLVAKYGADALRFGMLRQMRLESQELRFDERYCEKARDFNTKMWNALRYASGLPEGLPGAGTLPKPSDLTLADRWILTRLRDAIERVTAAVDGYEFGVAADALIDFIWYEYCDWYIEATKIPTPSRAAVLSYVLNTAVRLLHPISPFVTEEIWQALPHDGATIVTASWPDPAEIPADPAAVAEYAAVMRAVAKARDMRAELGVGPREKLTLEVPPGLSEDVRALLAVHAHAELADGLALPDGSTVEVLLGAVAVRASADALRDRYARDQKRLQGEVERLERKLGNEQFVAKAAPDVVAEQRAKLIAYREELARTDERLAALGR